MNRREEYWVLTEQLRREPPELESAVRRGMERARRRRRRPAELLAGLAGVCAAFVVMVNASPAFAISCAKVPVLRELAAAVAFSPSLRAAVEHDYVQYIGRTEGADRISVTAEYVIASPARAHLFYSVEGGGRVSWELQTPDGTPLEGYSSAQYSGTAGEAEELRHTEFHFSRGNSRRSSWPCAPWNRPDQQGKRKTGPRQWTGPESRRRGKLWPSRSPSSWTGTRWPVPRRWWWTPGWRRTASG